jgi:rod shape-determining protein MreC
MLNSVNGLRKWWSRSSSQLLVVLFLLLGVLWMRQERSGWLAEVFYYISYPFTLDSPPPEAIARGEKQALESRIQSLEEENATLRTLAKADPNIKSTAILARVVGRSADHWWQQMTLNRGSADGVEEQSMVMASSGLVGQIVSTTPHTSRVLLLTDANSRVGVVLNGGRIAGVLQGKGNGSGVVEFFTKTVPVKKGNLVTTSGLSSRFVPNLPVGKVISYDDTQAPPKAGIEFHAPTTGLAWVNIYPPAAPEAPEPKLEPITINKNAKNPL